MYELPNDLRLRKLGNFKKIPEMLGFDGKYPAVQPKAKFWRFLVKYRKKSAVKNSIEKPILLNFVNLSPTFCPRLSEETFSFQLSPDSLILYFLNILVFEKPQSLFKLIFKATQLQKITEYDIFQKILFCTLASNMNLGLNTVPVVAGQYLWRDINFFYQKMIIFRVSMHF